MIQQFEFPSFNSDGYGNVKADWGLNLDSLRKQRLEAIANSTKANDATRESLSKRTGVRIAEKSFQVNPLIGARSNVFGICDATEYGYGIYTDPTDFGNALLSWLDPLIINDRRRFDIPILDFRNYFNGGLSGTVDSLICTTGNPGSARRGDIGRCRINYCFDNNRGYKYCVDAAQLSDFQRDCFQQPPVNMFGQTFTNDPASHARLDDFVLMTGMKRLMVQKMLTGSWFASGLNWDGSPIAESTGLLNFVTDFPQRHPELATGSGCDCLLPKSITLPACPPVTATACDVENYWTSVFTLIENRVTEIEEMVMKMGGNANIPQDYWLLVMNWQDAKCIQWAQACHQACKNLVYSVNINPGEWSQAQTQAATDFYNRFRMGAYGSGRIILPSGRIIDIWAHPMFDFHPVDNPSGIPRGDIHLFCKGWAGGYGGGNRNAIRAIAQQWSEWLDYNRQRSALPERFDTMLNGTGMRVKPINPCDNLCVVFNVDVGFSNAAWMQTKFTGLCPCNEVPPIATFACNMPAVVPNALCAPN